MPVVAEAERVSTLRQWGVSDPLIRLSTGEVLHDQFNDACLGPPWYVYHGSVRAPDGPPLAVLWEWSEQVTGVWQQADGLEFIRYGFGRPDEFEVLAHTEQGFWVTQFDFLYECAAPLDELRAAAVAVGFRFLERHLASRQAAEARLGSFEGHRAWLREVVAGIDRDAQDAEPGAAPDPAT
jgi:hypothetical protein